MIFSTKILKTWIIALISKTLEAFSVWIDITTEPKKYVDLRESKIPFSDWSWKILIWLKHILYPNICFWESVTSLTLSQKVQITNAWKGNFGEWCGSNLWKHFASMSFFIPEIVLPFLIIDSFFTSLLRFVYIPTIFLPGLRGDSEYFLSPKRPYIYSILMVCNIMLLLILTRNAGPAPLLLISCVFHR